MLSRLKFSKFEDRQATFSRENFFRANAKNRLLDRQRFLNPRYVTVGAASLARRDLLLSSHSVLRRGSNIDSWYTQSDAKITSTEDDSKISCGHFSPQLRTLALHG